MPYKDPVVAKENYDEYRRLHRELIREQQRAYYVRHKEKLNAAHREYQRRPEVKLANRKKSVQRSYNVTPEQHAAILKRQGYRCAFLNCGVRVDLFSPIDHNHGCCPESARSCGKCVRSVLCTQHNLGLGYFERLNPKCLLDAYDYLRGSGGKT